MIAETEILFTDELADKIGREPQKIWGKISIDLREIIAVGEYIEENELVPEMSEITIRGGSSRFIRMPYEKLKALWKKANPQITFLLSN